MDSLIDIMANFSGWPAYLVIFVALLVCGLGIPLPEDISLFAAGLACYYGQAEIKTMITISLAGVLIGDSFVFGLGRRLGTNILQRRFISRLMSGDRIALVRSMMERRGNFIFFAARFMPGLRTAVFFSAGACGVPFRTFFLYDSLAALISVPTIVFTSFYFGDRIDEVIQLIRKTNTGIILALALIIVIVGLKFWLEKRRQHKQATLGPSDK